MVVGGCSNGSRAGGEHLFARSPPSVLHRPIRAGAGGPGLKSAALAQMMGAPGPAVGTGDSKNLNHPFPDPTPTKLPAENPDTPESAQNPCRWKSPAAPHAPAPSAQSAHRSAVRAASSAQIRSPSASAPESAPTQSSGSPSASESAGFPAPFICQRV